jgi:hypothetical protein
MKKHNGSCHCGAVKFEVEIDETAGNRCNCTVCTKTSTTNGIVKPDAFKLVSGTDQLSEYCWGPKISTRYFCRNCGVHAFARGELAELGGAYVSVNMNCLDGVETTAFKLRYWDGRHDNWQVGPRETPWPVLG